MLNLSESGQINQNCPQDIKSPYGESKQFLDMGKEILQRRLLELQKQHVRFSQSWDECWSWRQLLELK